MRIECVGGGPAGLSFAILASLAGHAVTVHERRAPDRSQGWGVVLWDDLLAMLAEADPQVAERIVAAGHRWHGQTITVTGRAPILKPGSGLGIGRDRLTAVLAARAAEVGAQVRWSDDAGDASGLGDADLVVGADGVRSAVRSAEPAFGTGIRTLGNRYLWLGTTRVLPTFEFPVVRIGSGLVWAHAYPHGDAGSTFVVETDLRTWRQERLGELDGDALLRRLEAAFAASLDGAALAFVPGTRSTEWLRFPVVTNARWSVGRTVLLGDAAHTTHFSIGSGTGLAIKDSLALAGALQRHGDLPTALAAYEAERAPAVRLMQREAGNSARFFEALPRYARHAPDRFAALVERRRSPLLGRMPLPVYLALTGAKRRASAHVGRRVP